MDTQPDSDSGYARSRRVFRALATSGTIKPGRAPASMYDARELIGTAGDDEPVSMRPFDAITFSLGELWD